MTNVNDAIDAGARAMWDAMAYHHDGKLATDCGWQTWDDAAESARTTGYMYDDEADCSHFQSELLGRSHAGAPAIWRVLSAPLRKLHPPITFLDGFIGCNNCPDECAVAEYILQTDKELGL